MTLNGIDWWLALCRTDAIPLNNDCIDFELNT